MNPHQRSANPQLSRHGLDATHYRCPATLEQEQQRLFGKLWNFVGFTSLVAERNQFITRTLAGVPVLVQRTEAGLRAFVNECPHRLSAIQTTPMGKRPLVCPYHAWSFGPEGQIRNIPNQQLYGFGSAERERICLKVLRLQTVGPLIFVSLDPEPLAIDDQFSAEFLQQLREAAVHLDEEVIYSCHRVNYNWKFAMENVKDHNHVPFVHPKSFAPAVRKLDHDSLDAAPASEVLNMLECQYAPQVSELSYSVKHLMKPGRPWFAQYCNTYDDDEHYRNWFIYPNVNFCSIKGAHFLLQQYEPVSAVQTDCHVWIMTARRCEHAPEFTALLATLMRGERAVIAEDTAVLERLQAGLGAHSSEFKHGNYEVALVKQHLWYRSNVLGLEP
ncbi:aromatic ring-hydroxylating oxygenase subunit alpha [Pseudomonas putida]